jgi:AraC family transcriptional regulator
MSDAAVSVPITMGSPTFRSMDLDGFAVTEAWFPAGEILQRHTHERASLAVMIGGSFDLELTDRLHHCPPSSVFIEPAGASHANFIGARGAHVLVVQPDPMRSELLHPFASILQESSHRHDDGIAHRAARLIREVHGVDALSPLAAEGLVLEMLVELSRSVVTSSLRPPPWLLRAQNLLHDTFAEPIRMADVASAVGVHPAHLARTFRMHFKSSMGSYVRRLRLEWAAGELAQSQASLADVALAAGFSDQAHLTRLFKRHFGCTPGRYRSLRQ